MPVAADTRAPTVAMLDAAAARLAGHIRCTPLLSSPALDAVARRRVLVKAECLQHTGSFKLRGAWAAVSALSPAARARGVIAWSSGNHAQGVAAAARAHGMRAVIVMPADAPRIKTAATRALGAELIPYDRAHDDREAIAAGIIERDGLTLIRPYDDPQVIAGQGRVGLELAAQLASEGIDQAEVLVPCGGGGLAAGVALALDARAPGLRVRPVEPEGHDDTARALAGQPHHPNPGPSALCDAILTPRPGLLTLPVLQRLAGPGLAVADHDTLRAMAAAAAHLKLVIEPGGAVALAAALFQPATLRPGPVVIIASGGNVDRALFARALDTED